jgi:hypothetical protein
LFSKTNIPTLCYLQINTKNNVVDVNNEKYAKCDDGVLRKLQNFVIEYILRSASDTFREL